MTTPNNPMFKAKYDALAKACEITPEEESVAKFFWYAGLRHAFQRGTSQAVLLNPVPSVPRQEPAALHPWSGLLNDQQRYKGYDSELSPYEAKLLSIAMQTLLASVQFQLKQFESQVNALWKYCDKDNEQTEETFKLMNQGRTKVRTLKKQYNALTGAQRKLKKLAKGL